MTILGRSVTAWRARLPKIRLPAALLAVPLPAWLVVFFVVPVALVVRESFLTYTNFRVLEDYNLDVYRETIFTEQFARTWWRTVSFAAVQSVIVLIFVYPYAYALAFHTRGRTRLFLLALTIAPFFVSYLVQVYAWQIVLAPHGIAHQLSLGLIPSMLRTEVGVRIVLLAYLWPLATLLLFVLGLSNIDPRYLKAAANIGASPVRVFTDVVIPLTRQAIMLVAMLAFVISFSDYLAAVGIGPPLRLLSVPLIDAARIGGDYPTGAAIAVAMMATILAIVVLSFLLTGPAPTREIGFERGTEPGGWTRWVWRAYLGLGLFFITLPVVVIGIYSFSGPKIPVWPIDSLSTNWYSTLLSHQAMLDSLWNSFKVSVAVGAGATLLGGLAAYYLSTRNPKWVVPYTLFAVAPAVAPTGVLSLGLLVFFSDIGVWGSLWAVVIAHVGLVAVFCLFIIRNQLAQIDDSIEAAARNLGAGKVTAVRDTVLPLALPAIVGSFVVAAGLSFGESLVASFLTSTTYTWPSYISQLVTHNISPEVFASAFLVYVGILVSLAVPLSLFGLFRWLDVGVRAHRRAKEEALLSEAIR
jgi:spermidine/putrescine transport system permease protein